MAAELNQNAIDYFNTFDWDVFLEEGCTPGIWSNCCDEGIPKLCLAEDTSRASGGAAAVTKSPCGGSGSSINDVVITMLRQGASMSAIRTMVRFLRGK